jgi:hypothetical protein
MVPQQSLGQEAEGRTEMRMPPFPIFPFVMPLI